MTPTPWQCEHEDALDSVYFWEKNIREAITMITPRRIAPRSMKGRRTYMTARMVSEILHDIRDMKAELALAVKWTRKFHKGR